MIVVIDDERSFDGADLHLRTSSQALGWLAQRVACDQIWFDHDLGGDDTTRPVASLLAEMAFDGNPYPVRRIVIHTMNPAGGAWLYGTLSRWYPTVRSGLPAQAGNTPERQVR